MTDGARIAWRSAASARVRGGRQAPSRRAGDIDFSAVPREARSAPVRVFVGD